MGSWEDKGASRQTGAILSLRRCGWVNSRNLLTHMYVLKARSWRTDETVIGVRASWTLQRLQTRHSQSDLRTGTICFINNCLLHLCYELNQVFQSIKIMKHENVRSIKDLFCVCPHSAPLPPPLLHGVLCFSLRIAFYLHFLNICNSYINRPQEHKSEIQSHS